MTASPKTERIHALDGLRGVACVAVLLLHVATMLELWGEGGPYPIIPGTPAVVVFFVLSGVVLSIAPLARLREGRPYDWLGYYPRRVVRLGLAARAAAVALGVVARPRLLDPGIDGALRDPQLTSTAPQPQVVHDVLMQFDVLFFVSDDTVTLFGDPLVRVNSPVWSMGWELWFFAHAAARSRASRPLPSGGARCPADLYRHLPLVLERVLSPAPVPDVLAGRSACQAPRRAVARSADGAD